MGVFSLERVHHLHHPTTTLCHYILQHEVARVLNVVTHPEQLAAVKALRHNVYRNTYPVLDMQADDPFDADSLVFFSCDDDGSLTATARLAFDHGNGLPSERLIQEHLHRLRQAGQKTAEFGRFCITDRARGLSPCFYASLYLFAHLFSVDCLVFVMSDKHLAKHQHLCGVQVLSHDIAEDFGSGERFIAVAWHLKDTPAAFFNWTKGAVFQSDCKTV